MIPTFTALKSCLGTYCKYFSCKWTLNCHIWIFYTKIIRTIGKQIINDTCSCWNMMQINNQGISQFIKFLLLIGYMCWHWFSNLLIDILSNVSYGVASCVFDLTPNSGILYIANENYLFHSISSLAFNYS